MVGIYYQLLNDSKRRSSAVRRYRGEAEGGEISVGCTLGEDDYYLEEHNWHYPKRCANRNMLARRVEETRTNRDPYSNWALKTEVLVTFRVIARRPDSLLYRFH